MTTIKFDNHDRKRVVSEIQKIYDVTLRKVGRREKILKDESGKSYWVLGGTGDWHGIPKEMFVAEEKQHIEGLLIIAKRKVNSIDIFAGSLLSLLKNKNLLTVTEGQYQFDISSKGDNIILKKAPDVRLRKISTIDYTKDEKASDKTIHLITKLLNKMPENAREMLQSVTQSK